MAVQLDGALIVLLKYHIKANVTIVAFKIGREKSNHGVYFFTNTVLQI